AEKLADTLAFVSAERKAAELKKLLCGDAVTEVLLAHRAVIASVIPEVAPCFDFPQNTPHHCYDVWEHTCRAVGNIAPEFILRMAMLLHDSGKPACFSTDETGIAHFHKHPAVSEKIAASVCALLKLSGAETARITALVLEHDNRIPVTLPSVRRTLAKHGEEFFTQYLQVRNADTLAQSMYKRAEKLAELETLAQTAHTILAQQSCLTLAGLAINGNDLTALGLQGQEVGAALRKCLNAVLDGTAENTREALFALLKTAQ
ncbi:MAG: HD domain-containing protein, partial [Oscillospiraceae bacterium]